MPTAPNPVEPVPSDYGSVTPYVPCRDAGAFVDFVVEAFDGVERFRVPDEDGRIGHAEVQLGDSLILSFDVDERWPDTTAFLSVYVEDCDAIHQRALEAGAVEVTPLGDSAWGDRGSRVRDPFGNIWWIQTHKEDLDDAEAERRMSDPGYLAHMGLAITTLEEEMTSRT